MNKRILYVILSFVFLFFLFFFLEERTENQTEINYWKKNWKTILYSPPKESWCGIKEPALNEDRLKLEIFDPGWNRTPVFSVTSLDRHSKQLITYEGNYNVKNTFSDLSVLKTKFIEKSTDVQKKLNCLTEDAPTLTLSEGVLELDKELVGKQLFFGRKSEADTSRVFARENENIISPYAYILEKFRSKSDSLRERQFISIASGYVNLISVTGQGLQIRAENSAKKNQFESYVNHWSRSTGDRIVLAPEIGNALENQTKALRADLYPDELNGPGFLVAKDFVQGTPEVILEVSHSDSLGWKLSFYPKILWKDQSYRPVIREIRSYFTESPTLVKEETFQSFLQAAMAVKNASRWIRPEQKIQ